MSREKFKKSYIYTKENFSFLELYCLINGIFSHRSSPCQTFTSLSTICDKLAQVITHQISPLMSTSCVARALVKTVLRVPYNISMTFTSKYQLVLAILYEFLRHLYEFYDICKRTTQHSCDIFTSSCEFVRVLQNHLQVSTTALCYNIYTRFVRQCTTTYESRSTFQNITQFLYDLRCKSVSY